MGAKQIDLVFSFEPEAQDNAVREHVEPKVTRYRLDQGRQIAALLRCENQWPNCCRRIAVAEWPRSPIFSGPNWSGILISGQIFKKNI